MGFSNSDIALGMLNTLKIIDNDKIITNNIKLLFIDIICRTNLIISRGIDTKLQLLSCVSLLNTIVIDKNNQHLLTNDYFYLKCIKKYILKIDIYIYSLLRIYIYKNL